MPNDQQWQRRTDEWVKTTHASRLKKEKELAEKKRIRSLAKEKIEKNS